MHFSINHMNSTKKFSFFSFLKNPIIIFRFNSVNLRLSLLIILRIVSRIKTESRQSFESFRFVVFRNGQNYVVLFLCSFCSRTEMIFWVTSAPNYFFNLQVFGCLIFHFYWRETFLSGTFETSFLLFTHTDEYSLIFLHQVLHKFLGI